jgi:Flp pilus assembly protein TadG
MSALRNQGPMRARRLRNDRAGAAAVEFAIIFPILLLFLFGIYEFGRLFWIQSSLQFAAEQAGRWAMANSTAGTGAIQTQCANSLTSVGLGGLSCSVTTTNITSSAGLTVPYNVITNSYEFSFVTGMPFSTVTGTTFTLSGKSQVPKL